MEILAVMGIASYCRSSTGVEGWELAFNGGWDSGWTESLSSSRDGSIRSGSEGKSASDEDIEHSCSGQSYSSSVQVTVLLVDPAIALSFLQHKDS